MIVKNIEKKENNAASFQVETDAAEFEAAVNGAYLKNRSNIYIPGFRKGKAPRAVVEGMYGTEVFYQDAIDELAPKAFEKGMEESKLHTVGAPAISNINVTENRTVEYTFDVTLYPEVTLGQYKGLEAVKPTLDVSDEVVNRELEATRKRNARMLDVDDRAAQMGDTVDINFDGFLNGERFDGGKAENYSLELGSNSFVPGFEDQIVGMQIGEEKDLDITFPENYVEDLAGKAVVFKVKLNAISVPELPELDDEFAKDVSEFDTLEEYKADIRAKMEKRNAEQADNAFRTELMHLACDNMTVDVPEVMVTDKVEEIVRNYANNFGMNSRDMSFDQLCKNMGLDQEVISTSIRPNAEFQVKSDMLLEAIAEAENIEVSEEDIEAYIQKVADSVGMPAADIRDYFGTELVTAELKKEKAGDILVNTAVAKEAEQAPVEESAE